MKIFTLTEQMEEKTESTPTYGELIDEGREKGMIPILRHRGSGETRLLFEGGDKCCVLRDATGLRANGGDSLKFLSNLYTHIGWLKLD